MNDIDPQSLSEIKIILKDIHNLLLKRIPFEERKPFYHPRRWNYWIILLLISLFFLDFPTYNHNSDIVVLNNSEISIIKLPEPKWEEQGLPPMAEYWSIPQLKDNVSLLSLWDFSLFHQNMIYKSTAIRVVKTNGEPKIDLLSPPILVNGQTRLSVSKLLEFDEGDYLLAKRIIRTHALKIDDQIIPLYKFINSEDYFGSLTISTKPRIGFERFVKNLSTAFGLLK